jgi:hypothetical protein
MHFPPLGTGARLSTLLLLTRRAEVSHRVHAITFRVRFFAGRVPVLLAGRLPEFALNRIYARTSGQVLAWMGRGTVRYLKVI